MEGQQGIATEAPPRGGSASCVLGGSFAAGTGLSPLGVAWLARDLLKNKGTSLKEQKLKNETTTQQTQALQQRGVAKLAEPFVPSPQPAQTGVRHTRLPDQQKGLLHCCLPFVIKQHRGNSDNK